MIRSLLVVAFLTFAPVAYAQDAVVTQATDTQNVVEALASDPTVVVAQSPQGDTVVTVPAGNWIGNILGWARDIVITAVIALLGWASRRLPKIVADILMMARVEQILARAVDYGINATKDATRAMTFDVNVGSSVVANALQYAVNNAPTWVISWAGGEGRLRDKIIARIPLDSATTAGAVARAIETK